MAKLKDKLAALATMSSAQLRAEWARVHRAPAPALPADLLLREIAYVEQERVHGGLPTSTRRQVKRLGEQLDRTGDVAVQRDVVLRPGTRLARDWHGTTHHVLVLDEGFLFEDRRYASLTRIANEITGANWSGPRFFGLKNRRNAAADGQLNG